MNTMYQFHEFTFTTASKPGCYIEGLPLKKPSDILLPSHGRILGMFEIHYPEVLPIGDFATEVIPFFSRKYYDKPCFSVHEHLLESVKETQTFIVKKLIEYGALDSIDFTLIMSAVWGNVLYVARCGGDIGLRLYRDSTFGTILPSVSQSGTDHVVSLSGYIQDRDGVVLYHKDTEEKEFPLSMRSLVNVSEPSVVYSKVQELFGNALKGKQGTGLNGFYITTERVPSVDEDRLEIVDIGAGSEVMTEKSDDFIEKQLEIDEKLQTKAENELTNSPAVISSIRSRIFSNVFLNNLESRRFKFISFFTKKRVFFLACVFLLLFIGLVVIGKDYENRIKSTNRSAEVKAELLPKIRGALDQGKYYAALNPDRAREYLEQARNYVKEFDAVSLNDNEVQNIIKEVNSQYAVITKTYEFNELTPYFDLTALNDSATGEKLAVNNGLIIVTDSLNNVVYQIGIANRSAKAVMGPNDLDRVISAEGDDDYVFAVSDKGITRVKGEDSNAKQVIESSSGWGKIADMQIFGSNIYLLDSGKNQIWKYVPDGETYGTVRNYVASDDLIDLEDANSMSIDGSVWVIRKNGMVVKFVQGRSEQFKVKGMEGELQSLSAGFTDENSDYLYLLEPARSRVVVVNKNDSSYVSNYSFKGFGDGSDVMVDTEANVLYVLAKQKIYKVELRENKKERK